MMLIDDASAWHDDSPQRRLSLNNRVTIPTTFLAGPVSSQDRGSRVKQELDTDFHSSLHGSPSAVRAKIQPWHLTEPPVLFSPIAVSCDGDDTFDEDESFDSDCDTFCDASVQEAANREYLRKDLGASCFWSSIDTCSLTNANEFLDEIERDVNAMIDEERIDDRHG
jgi:hypothetical protein